ncbi:hypothetical protein KP509_14G002600 [Ceratopteris richardii]|nr:hypothetical protein KP509_14G002600 [Ceratopteris richardii]
MSMGVKERTSSLVRMEDKRVFIFGVGYVGLAFARHLHSQAWNISGTCSSEDRRIAVQEAGFQTFLFNSNDGTNLSEERILALQNATHVLVSIPPVAELDGDLVLSTYKEQIYELARNTNLHWIAYLSSTGVYGDHHGEWVDERSEAMPVDKHGIARLNAEKEWLQLGHETGACIQIFRLGGVYGPGRSAIDTLLRSEGKSFKQRKRERRRYTSRIHISDVVQVLMAGIKSPCPGVIYNVVDDDPAPRSEVFSHARDLIHEKLPHLSHLMEQNNLESANVQDWYLTSSPEKRVSNLRIKNELKIKLIHPTYRSGLEAIVNGMSQ